MGLSRRGIVLGSVVALTLPSVPEYVIAYAALAKVGAVTAGVNPRLTDAERATALEVVGPDLVLGDPAEVNALRVDGESPPALPDDPERPVAIVLTSGTTGRPRGAEFRVRQLAAITAADVGDTWGGGGPMLASTQFAHVGFMTKLAWYLRLRTTQLLIDRWRASTVLDQIEQHRVPSVGGVAPQIALLLREPDFDDRDLDCVQTIIVGAAPSPPALVHEARERFGAGYSIRYSSTECGGVGTGTAFDAPDSEALYTVGRPRPPVELSIRDDDGRPVPDGERRRGLPPLPLRDGRLLERPRGHRRRPTGRLAALRRPRPRRRGRLRAPGRPGQGDVHPGWLQRVPPRGRGRAVRAPRRRRGGCGPPTGRGHGRGRRRRRRPPRHHVTTVPGRAAGLRRATGCPLTSSPKRSASSTPCPSRPCRSWTAAPWPPRRPGTVEVQPRRLRSTSKLRTALAKMLGSTSGSVTTTGGWKRLVSSANSSCSSYLAKLAPMQKWVP